MAGPGPVILLLQAIRSLTKAGGIKTIKDAYRLAQRELGPRFNQLKKQVDDAFNQFCIQMFKDFKTHQKLTGHVFGN